MKLLVGMNLAPRWVEFLKAAGFDATYWSELGAPDAQDAEIMEYARDKALVVFTHELDFGSILAASHGGTPSVIQVRANDPSPRSWESRSCEHCSRWRARLRRAP